MTSSNKEQNENDLLMDDIDSTDEFDEQDEPLLSSNQTNSTNTNGSKSNFYNQSSHQVVEDDKRKRRAIANSNERRRMQSINAGFQTLKNLIPHSSGEKLSKACILQRSADFMQYLSSEKEKLNQKFQIAIKLIESNHQLYQQYQAKLNECPLITSTSSTSNKTKTKIDKQINVLLSASETSEAAAISPKSLNPIMPAIPIQIPIQIPLPAAIPLHSIPLVTAEKVTRKPSITASDLDECKTNHLNLKPSENSKLIDTTNHQKVYNNNHHHQSSVAHLLQAAAAATSSSPNNLNQPTTSSAISSPTSSKTELISTSINSSNMTSLNVNKKSNRSNSQNNSNIKSNHQSKPQTINEIMDNNNNNNHNHNHNYNMSSNSNDNLITCSSPSTTTAPIPAFQISNIDLAKLIEISKNSTNTNDQVILNKLIDSLKSTSELKNEVPVFSLSNSTDSKTDNSGCTSAKASDVSSNPININHHLNHHNNHTDDDDDDIDDIEDFSDVDDSDTDDVQPEDEVVIQPQSIIQRANESTSVSIRPSVQCDKSATNKSSFITSNTKIRYLTNNSNSSSSSSSQLNSPNFIVKSSRSNSIDQLIAAAAVTAQSSACMSPLSPSTSPAPASNLNQQICVSVLPSTNISTSSGGLLISSSNSDLKQSYSYLNQDHLPPPPPPPPANVSETSVSRKNLLNTIVEAIFHVEGKSVLDELVDTNGKNNINNHDNHSSVTTIHSLQPVSIEASSAPTISQKNHQLQLQQQKPPKKRKYTTEDISQTFSAQSSTPVAFSKDDHQQNYTSDSYKASSNEIVSNPAASSANSGIEYKNVQPAQPINVLNIFPTGSASASNASISTLTTLQAASGTQFTPNMFIIDINQLNKIIKTNSGGILDQSTTHEGLIATSIQNQNTGSKNLPIILTDATGIITTAGTTPLMTCDSSKSTNENKMEEISSTQNTKNSNTTSASNNASSTSSNLVGVLVSSS